MNNAVIIVALRFAPLVLLIFFGISMLHFLKTDIYPAKKKTIYNDKDIESENEEENIYSLVVKKENLSEPGEKAGVSWLISEKITLGREEDNNIIIKNPYASGYHARIEQRGKELWIEDLKSTNGTYVNGKRILGKVLLKPGDFISIGQEALKVERGGGLANSSSNPYGIGTTEK